MALARGTGLSVSAQQFVMSCHIRPEAPALDSDLTSTTSNATSSQIVID